MNKYQDFFNELVETPVISYWKDFVNYYTDEIKFVVDDIVKNGGKYNTEKWNEIYDKYNEIEPVIIALCKQECCPNAIIDKIIRNLDKKHDAYSIIHSILCRNSLTDIQISDMVSMKKYEIGKFFPTYNSSMSEKWNIPFDENTTNKIIKEIYKRDGKKMNADFLLYTSDREFIKNILEEQKDYEIFKNVLVNNFCLSDSERNEIFDSGCNRKNVERPTDYMISVMYRESVEAYFENDYNSASDISEKRSLEEAYYDGFAFILQMIRKGFVSDAMQMDLMFRLTQLRERSENSILIELLKTAKVEQIFKDAETGIVSKDKNYMYKNKNCPTDILYRRAYSLTTKIEKALQNKKPVSDNWIEQMSVMLNRIRLTTGNETVLLNIPGKKLNKNLACSPFTSIETLEKIQTDASDAKNQMIASVNIALQRAGMYGESLEKYLY